MERFHIKNADKFVGVKMDGTLCHAHNINFAYSLSSLDEAKRMAGSVKKLMSNQPTEITDSNGQTLISL